MAKKRGRTPTKATEAPKAAEAEESTSKAVVEEDDEMETEPEPEVTKKQSRMRASAAPDVEEEDDEEEEAPVVVAAATKTRRVRYDNKQRVLVVCSRGISARHRHLMEDLKKLLPHHKADTKLDSKGDPRALNDIAELKSCNGCVYLEARKRTDLYMWLSRCPAGPSAKFLVQNVHTMDELRLTGNCGLGTRPLLCFDSQFDDEPQWRAMKQILAVTFGTPRGHPKSKPFFDHSFSFSIADGKIWLRHYQILDAALDDKTGLADVTRGDDSTSLVEIGPRLVLSPIRVFSGSFGGATLFHDSSLVLPNEQRSLAKAQIGSKYVERRDAVATRKEHIEANAIQPDELADTFRDEDDEIFG